MCREIWRIGFGGGLRGAVVSLLLGVCAVVSVCEGSLPVIFDWREGAALPPVREQGLTCQSDWAICAVDIVESALAIQRGTTVDLSEQWLVSCTQGGNGCDGAVMEWGLESMKCSGSGHPDVCGDSGAVLEEDLPYTGTDEGCGCPYSHPYCIESWGYVGETETPTDEQIKQAIVDYGPVACYMDVYGDLISYSGGVYMHMGGGTPMGEKAVVIVGWFDNNEARYWVAKNTWGTSWGEGGYFRVAFGAAGIGRRACYVGTVVGQDHYCGEPGQFYLRADLNEDCYVNLADIALMAADWLRCTDLSDAACSWE